MLAIENWSSTCRSLTPSALPVVPLHVPSGVMTVADMPPPLVTSCEARAAWSLAASASDTGSSLMAANAWVGNALGVGPAVVALVADGVAGDVIDGVAAPDAAPQPTTRSAATTRGSRRITAPPVGSWCQRLDGVRSTR